MRFITEYNVRKRINRALYDHGTGEKLHKARSGSVATMGKYYLASADGSIVSDVNLEQLARQLGCLKKSERIGEPPKRTSEETASLIDELARKIAAGKAQKKRIARDFARIPKFVPGKRN